MKPRKGMNHADHVELAEILRPVHDALTIATIFCSGTLGKTANATKFLRRTLQMYELTRSELDDCYHRATTDEQFLKDGHVYYRDGRRRKAPVLTLVPRKRGEEC